MLESITLVEVGVAAAGLYVLKRVLLPSKLPAPYPPGPKGLPLLGNLTDMPTEYEWKTFAEWGKRYGDICAVHIFGQTIVILNSARAAWDMLDKKSSVYSNRPVLVMGGELVGWDQTMILEQYTDRWVKLRKMLHQEVGTKEHVKALYPLEQLETHRMLRRIYEHPDKFVDAIRKTVGKIFLKVSHGHDVKEGPDEIIDSLDQAAEDFSGLSKPGAYLVDVLPFLRYVPAWVPGAGFQRTARRLKKNMEAVVDTPHNMVKKDMANGTAVHSFTAVQLQEPSITPEQENVIKWTAFSIYGGGGDTTVSAMHSFFIAMALNPEVLAKAHAEIDAVLGPDRLPTFEDAENLPYIEAIVKEVFRWNPVTPLGMPHCAQEDGIHEGYFIPKGSLVMANQAGMLQNETMYPNPKAFNPERFIKTATHEPEQDPKTIAFGFGRRICPGIFVADASVWLVVAMSLAAFDISMAPGTVVPEDIMMSGTISHPKPFNALIKPRSSKALELIMAVDLSEH